MNAPMDIDQSLSSTERRAQEFNRQVENRIAEYKKKHPDFFIEETRLRLASMDPLLDIIVTTHAPSLELDQDQREGYLESNELQAALRLAYEKKTFADLRKNPHMPFADKGGGESISGPPMQRGGSDPGLKSAFEQPYRGQADRLLIHTLNKYRRENVQANERKDQPYNWSISVIQSSGMGKSRMVDQAAESVFTIPINIREETPGVLTFPPPDKKVRGYFKEAKYKPDTAVQAAYAIFLTVLFDKASTVTKLISKGEKGAKLAAKWAKYLKDTSKGSAKTGREVFLDAVVKEATQLRDSRGSSPLTDIFEEMKDKCAVLVGLVSEHNTEANKTNACFVYFDEAHSLTEPVEPVEPVEPLEPLGPVQPVEVVQPVKPVKPVKPVSPEGQRRTPYHNLGTVLAELQHFRVFFIFLSTNSHLQRFAPPAMSHPSARVWLGPRLFPPFTELPFDVFVDVVAQELRNASKEWTLENVCHTDVMVGFGRSMWYAHHKTWQASKRYNHVLTFARMKLTNGLLEKTRSQSRLAALGVRIGISFDLTTQSSRERESALVESHMRVVYAVPEHREFMHAGSPSEPVLAEAAAQYLDGSAKPNRIQHLGPEVLSEACMAGFLARGERGELCARLLMTVAHDMALQEHYSKLGDTLPAEEPRFHQPVPVLDFLRALFAEAHHETVLHARSVTRKPGVATLEEAFKDSFVCFSHFALAGNSEMLQAHNLASALVRGMAIQAKDNQPSIDAVIPVHMGPVTSRIAVANTSAINLQIKNRKCPEVRHIDRELTISNLTQPVISIIIEFGDDASSSRNTVTVQDISSHATRNRNPVHRDDHHYEIVAHGRGSKVFKAIPESAEQHYNLILAKTGLLEDFPRKDSEQNLEGLYGLKPFFNGDGIGEWKARNPDLA